MKENEYIPITILNSEAEEVDFQEIMKNKISIILGNPGSGKTTLLKHYKNLSNQSESQLLSVKALLRIPNRVKQQTKVLFLDGIDEYRVASQDETFVAEELGWKIDEILQKQPELKIILTCREIDWFGEDYDKLQEYVIPKVKVFHIQPLDLIQQKKFAEMLIDKDKDGFFEKFQNNVFLTNPQLFYMLSEIWNKQDINLTSKIDIYKTFIETAVAEYNPKHEQCQFFLEKEQTLKLLGYLSYFYFFCGIEEFSPAILKHISAKEHGYPHSELKQLVKTNVFSNYYFSHTTIAEFALAYHIVNFQSKEQWNYKRIRTLFANQRGNISSRLRGAYAWLCLLSNSISLIKMDPYYQTIYGDNSLLNTKEKQNILKALREYSKKNPYFINFSQDLDLRGFYSRELDQVLMSEYDEALKLNNHYVYFLSYIIVQGGNISENMEFFLEEKIKQDIPYYYKLELLKYFQKDVKKNKDFILKILKLVIDEEINDDENSLKDFLLGLLYPKYVKPQEIADYLIRYKETDVLYQHYLYLFDTPFEYKKALVEEILNKKDQINNKKYSFLPYYIYAFIKDFFFDVYLKTTDIREIFTCLMDFQYDYFKYNKIEIEPFGNARRKEAEKNREKLQNISDQLFKMNVQARVYGEDDFWTYNIYHFPYYCSPTNKTQVFQTVLKEMTQKGEEKESERYTHKKSEVFFAWLNSLSQEEKKGDGCRKTAEEFGLLKEYKEYVLKEEKEEEKNKKREQEQQERNKINQDKNEFFFKEQGIEELMNNFNAMNWIAELYLYRQNDIGRYITLETFEKKLKVALKEILYVYPHPFSNVELTIDELSKQPQNSIRNIDTMYYASICVNSGELKYEELDANFKPYLYIVSLWYENMHNVQDVDFCEFLENNDTDFVFDTLKKYIRLLAERCFDDKEITTTILKNLQKETRLKNLKLFAKLHENDDNLPTRFVHEFLKMYGFSLELEELDSLNKACIGEKNCEIVRALQSLHNNISPDIESALSIFSLLDAFPGYEEKFSILDNSLKIKILTYLMKAFNTKELLKEKRSASTMSTRDLCVWFLKYAALARIDENDLQTLLNSFQNTVWEYKILHAINKDEENINYSDNSMYKIDAIRKMITQDTVVNEKMFLELIYHRLQNFGEEIRVNEINEKNTYYNTIGKKHDWTPKKEEEIRDILFHNLKTRYENDSIWTKEKYEANNRVDIHVKYYWNRNFKVQIECKKDTNSELISGIKDQLIDKYLRAEDSFGIYLVFYFGEAKYDKEEILKLLHSELESGENLKYKERIKILIIDFTLA